MITKTYPIAEKILTQGQQLNQTLLTVLEKEAEKLGKSATATDITELAKQKKQTAQQLEQFNQQMTQILATESLDFSLSGLEDYFAKAQAANLNTQKGRESWQNILTLVHHCHLLNEQNGASVALLIRHNQRIQQIFRGKNQLATTYTANGATSSVQFSRAIASV
jgi:flagella synthesis protein FlgN